MNYIDLSPNGTLADTQLTEKLLDELRQLIADLGKDGGIISPSVYDTAQVLRFYPPEEGVESALEWLLAQQQPDGGWGDPAFELARMAPTLAAILAIATHSDHWSHEPYLMKGVQFLEEQSPRWRGQLPADIPVAAELIIPNLLSVASEIGLPLDSEAFCAIQALGQRRRELIAATKPRAGSTAAFSWEAWGCNADPAFLDSLGSVGHSPSATAAWLNAAVRANGSAPEHAGAAAYLQRAGQRGPEGNWGLFPTAWPINRFEQVFGLYALAVTGILTWDDLRSAVEPQLDSIRSAMTPAGIGFSDFFEPDGDNTAAAVTAFGVFGQYDMASTLSPYQRETHFTSYPYELQLSLSVTGRAIHAYRVNHLPVSQWGPTIVEYQCADGIWSGDKWNISWIYTTAHMIFACTVDEFTDTLERAKQSLLSHQYEDGGWGAFRKPSRFETALAVIALHKIMAFDSDPRIRSALSRARRWFDEADSASGHEDQKTWLNKELYSVPRIEHVFILAGRLLLTTMDAYGQDIPLESAYLSA